MRLIMTRILYDARMGVKFTLKRKIEESLPSIAEVTLQMNVLGRAKTAQVLL